MLIATVHSSNDSNSGSGFNRLCMPFTPDFVNASNNQEDGSYLWGAEYQSDGFGIFDLEYIYDQPVACAVCEVSKPGTLMIPATTDCPAGWMMEYSGYLMTNSDVVQRGVPKSHRDPQVGFGIQTLIGNILH